MEQEIRFCPTTSGRIAYAVSGSGPALVLPAWWVSHQEVLWQDPGFRAFVTALAERHTVVRYDRLGTGLSDRNGPLPLRLEDELDVLDRLLDHLAIERCTLFGFSAGSGIGAAYAAARPRRVTRLIAYGGHARGALIADAEARQQMVDLVRSHWGVGSRLLASVFFPEGDAETLDWFARYQRESATPDVAAQLLEALYATDVRDALLEVAVPTLVLHRADDRAVPVAAGREIAALVPDARFRLLVGSAHPPWHGDTASVLAAMAEFIQLGPYPFESAGPKAVDAPALSERELDVLRLVAEGLSNDEIAERLVLSPHTVHRHVANVRTKLQQPSRTGAAAAAIRAGLI